MAVDFVLCDCGTGRNFLNGSFLFWCQVEKNSVTGDEKKPATPSLSQPLPLLFACSIVPLQNNLIYMSVPVCPLLSSYTLTIDKPNCFSFTLSIPLSFSSSIYFCIKIVGMQFSGFTYKSMQTQKFT